MTAGDHPDGRAWVAVYQWPDKVPFYFGTVMVRLGAPDNEIEAAVEKLWSEVYPAELRPPKLVGLQPGQLVFMAE